jgi:type IV pilus assembly protein PilC
MGVYSYIALDDKGQEQQGQVEAGDAREAARSLRERAIFVVEIQEGASGIRIEKPAQRLLSGLRWLSPRQHMPVRPPDLVLFFRQVALMLRAGHTIVEALEASREMVPKQRLRQVIERMSEGIQRGQSFSAALAAEKQTFSPMMAKLIESGEEGGELDPILERLAVNLEKRVELKRQLKIAMTYPSFVVVGSIGVSAFLVISVVPRFAKFLNTKKVDIPASTQVLMDIADWFQVWGATLGISLMVITFSLLAAYTTKGGKKVIDRVILILPVVGTSVVYSGMAQAGWTLSMLLRSGVTALQSLRVTSGVMGNRTLADCFESAADQILEGRNLSTALNQGDIPLMVRHMAAVGERSGQLEVVMQEVGEFYRKELEAQVKAMTAMVEPTLILMVGGMVGFVYYAFFQAVLKVSTGGM